MGPRAIVKGLALAAARSTAAHHMLPRRFAGMGVIFMSHRVIEPGEVVLAPSQAITTRFLARCLEHVRSRGLEIVSLDQLCERLSAPSRGSGFVCFTFDDGYRDNVTRGLPIFERFRAPLSIYVTTGFPDRQIFYWWRALEQIVVREDQVEVRAGSGWQRLRTQTLAEKRAAYARLSNLVLEGRRDAVEELIARHGVDVELLLREETLSWRELAALASNPLVTIGAHSVTHPVLNDLDGASARREIASSKARLERMLGVPVEHFAYPFGHEAACGEREYALARESGFRSATTTRVGNIFEENRRHLWSLPRISLDCTGEHMSDLELHLAGVTSAAAMCSRFLNIHRPARAVRPVGPSGRPRPTV